MWVQIATALCSSHCHNHWQNNHDCVQITTNFPISSDGDCHWWLVTIVCRLFPHLTDQSEASSDTEWPIRSKLFVSEVRVWKVWLTHPSESPQLSPTLTLSHDIISPGLWLVNNSIYWPLIGYHKIQQPGLGSKVAWERHKYLKR